VGYDISNHPIEPHLIRDRLIPFVMGEGDVDDLIDRAVKVGRVAREAERWGKAVLQLDLTISREQREVAPERIQEFQVPAREPNLFDRWFKRTIPTVTRQQKIPGWTTGIPGFDSDLHYWGRPFFISADSTEDVLSIYQQYLETAPDDSDRLQALIARSIHHLEEQRTFVRSETSPEAIEVLNQFFPLSEHLELEEDREYLTQNKLRQRAGQTLHLLREAYQKRDQEVQLPIFGGRQTETPRRILSSALNEMVNFAAILLPGWMGRGYVWPTALFEKIGVDVSHIFEKPTALFEPLLSELTELHDELHPSIPANFSLGGYVPPDKIGEFVELLHQHKWDLVFAWEEDGADRNLEPAQLAEWTPDWLKIVEPATYAQQHGLGFIEAAEIYSGPFGWMN
jgi:hypothetical protein